MKKVTSSLASETKTVSNFSETKKRMKMKNGYDCLLIRFSLSLSLCLSVLTNLKKAKGMSRDVYEDVK